LGASRGIDRAYNKKQTTVGKKTSGRGRLGGTKIPKNTKNASEKKGGRGQHEGSASKQSD